MVGCGFFFFGAVDNLVVEVEEPWRRERERDVSHINLFKFRNKYEMYQIRDNK